MTTTAQPGQDQSYIAGASLASDQFKFVKIGTADFNVILVTSATASVPVGVLQNDPASGEGATVRTYGQTKAIAGGTVTRGATMTMTAGGTVQDKNGSDVIVGRAVNSGASGDVVTINLDMICP